MNAIRSVVKNGRVEVDTPPDWPDGTPVRVEIALSGQAGDAEERPETPEEIEAWLRWYHSLEPIVMTPEEEAACEADRKLQEEFDIANSGASCIPSPRSPRPARASGVSLIRGGLIQRIQDEVTRWELH